ncbi:PTS system mannose/fructose/N-acetylgalactosamine-transporter subunit IIB [Elusimicrobiota bacterium]
MSMTLVRIDDRLIHGQVVEGWVPSLDIRRIIVISDEAAGDKTQVDLMELAVPDAVALDICTVSAGVEALERAARSAERTMILLPGPREALALLEGGAAFESVNVGGLHYAAGTLQLGKAIFLNKGDIEALEAIAKRGVEVEGRGVPTDSPMDIIALIRSRV